ncbi:hypothetical protein V1291_001525 [Nitrobacteraceae bacterium AZCC 1564]
MSSHFHYDPSIQNPFLGIRMPVEQLAALDAARLKMRLNRSEFVRRSIAIYLEQLQTTAN